MNLIDMDLLASNLRAYRRTASQHNSVIYLSKAYDEFISDVAQMPTVDAEPVRHGHWIDNDIDPEAWNFCSVCGEQAIDNYDYCPNCGAKMDEEE